MILDFQSFEITRILNSSFAKLKNFWVVKLIGNFSEKIFTTDKLGITARKNSKEEEKSDFLLNIQRGGDLSSIRRGEGWQFRAECVEDFSATQNPEIGAFSTKPPTTIVRDAAHYG